MSDPGITPERHEHRVVHLRVAYTLWGAVTDPTALAELITRGIGPAKRYGCGLLVVASTDRSLR
ncbi:CRISPR associated protein [Pseudonocardia thermophila]|uniref:CRISPR associated protein n=1 Tax=Pseudonocardia thermophila TaxID=1848 RepID=A0A1M7AW23_PSETH|nr:type I-E CRISPR-associated protein Cas6/Cse3/CasE [Pseudonocardia thermophila]SHL46933.1 CRISPR associated protein [Pseudonocardia thermophila]